MQNSKQSNKVQAKKERGLKMQNQITKQEKKISKATQQNLIEMLTYLYRESSFTIDRMAHELDKSRRTVFRFIETINSLYPAVVSSLNFCDGQVRLSFAKKISEKELDDAFAKNNNLPIIYIFLKSLIRPIYVQEIQDALNINRKAAAKIIENIADCSPYGDFADYEFDWEV